jgi:BolA protein
MTATITERLQAHFNPVHLDVLNESHMHNVPAGSESHFKVVIVSAAFTGQSLVNRHRSVNALLGELFHQGLHALALHTLTPDEWYAQGGQAPESPPCLGGKHAG